MGSRLHQRVAAAWVRPGFLSLSAGLGLGVGVCFWTRANGAAAITILPAGAWLALGLLLWLAGSWRVWRQPATLGVAALWMLYTLAFVEEPRSLARGLLPGPTASATTIRVVSLNCAGGSAIAAAETVAYSPDVVLLQEVPGEAVVAALTEQLFGVDGGYVWGPDTAILAAGEVSSLLSVRRPPTSHTRVRVRLTQVAEFEVVSLRLDPPPVEISLWNPATWRLYSDDRYHRRNQLAEIVAGWESQPTKLPLLVGGDFNAPAGDAVFRLLQPRLRDAFRSAGRGCGNTIINSFPFHRIDQIWHTREFRPVSVVARRTEHSDHRMVVADLAY